MLVYQIVNSRGKPFGSPTRSADKLLRMIPARLRPIMTKLGMRVTLAENQSCITELRDATAEL
jgi:hypothetical protein